MKPFNPDCWYREVCDGYADNCQMHCARYLKMRYLMEHSGIPINKCKPLPLYPEECDRNAFIRLAEVKDDIDNFVEKGKNLYITSGGVGNGKTAWSLKLMLKYFEKIWEDSNFEVRGVFVYVPAFLIKCKEFKSVDPEFEALKKNILDADLVIWDDIACTEVSPYDLNQLSLYIDSRVFKGLSNIYTGNLPNRDLLEHSLGTRLTSRIWNGNTEIVELHGGDRR